MNAKEVEALLTATGGRSLYEAACTLNYAPSVISKHIANVEAEPGVCFFWRRCAATVAD